MGERRKAVGNIGDRTGKIDMTDITRTPAYLKVVEFCDGWNIEYRNIWVEEDACYRTTTITGFDTQQAAEDWARDYAQADDEERRRCVVIGSRYTRV
jgi:hypothetical protein